MIHDGCMNGEAAPTLDREFNRVLTQRCEETPSIEDMAVFLTQNKKWQVFPLHAANPTNGLCTCGNDKCTDQGKHPRTANGFRDSSSSPDQIHQWWSRWDNSNIWIPTGHPNFIVVLDVDPRHDGDKSLARLETECGKLPDTFTVKTGGGGFHYYFSRFSGPKIKSLSNALGDEYPGLDMKGEGGYVVGPGSRHVSGGSYTIVKDIDLVDVPEWLEKLITVGSTTTGTAFKAPDHIQNGTRNNTLYRTAISMKNKGIADGAVMAALREENKAKCSPALDDSEIENIVSSACSFVREHPPIPQLQPDGKPRMDSFTNDLYTQIRIADQFIEGHIDTWRYNIDRKQWFFWTGKVWEADENDRIKNVDKEFLKDYLALIPTMQIGKGVVDLTKFIVSLNTSKGIRDILSIAAPGMTIRDHDLDNNPYLLNCQNGTLDIKTGVLRDHDREDFCSRIANTNYIPGAECLLWEKHIATIFENDKELIGCVQELLGYSLFLGNPDAVFAVFFGSGRNGKSVTLEVISHLLGNYSTSVSPNSFMSEGDRAGSDRILMHGARLITASEPSDSSKKRCELDTGFIKTATGNDPVSARRLYCEGTTFKVLGLVVLSTNALPKIHDQSVAIWDRLWCVPFNHYFMPEDRDKGISEKLIVEGPGVLNWLKAGYDRYQVKNRLVPCAAISDQTKEYRRDEDFYTPFFDSGTVIIKPGLKISASKLYTLYETWFKLQFKEPKKPVSTTKFGRDMSTRFKKVHGHDGWVYQGIGDSGQGKISDDRHVGGDRS